MNRRACADVDSVLVDEDVACSQSGTFGEANVLEF